MSFVELCKYANLKSPFEDGCVSSIISEIATWLRANGDNLETEGTVEIEQANGAKQGNKLELNPA